MWKLEKVFMFTYRQMNFYRTKFFNINKEEKEKRIKNNLEIYLASIVRQDDHVVKLAGSQAREDLLKKEKEGSELVKLLDEICKKQEEIVLLEVQEQFFGSQEARVGTISKETKNETE